MASPTAPSEIRVAAQSDSSSEAIVFENVSIAFEENVVLDGVSFRLPRGETKALFGVAGSGKSTILKMALGLQRPDSGRIFALGEEVTRMTEEELFAMRRRVGIVFQESALFDSLNVRDNVAFRLMEEHISAEEIEQRVLESLRFVELEHTIDKFPSQLSGGMRRRVAIARAIITQPEVLLYDSPTGGLDPVTSTTIIELIVKQRDVHHTPSILVTHRLQDAFTLCSHRYDIEQGRMVPLPKGQTDQTTTFMMLDEGRLVFSGSLHDLIHSENPFVQEFIE